MKRKLAQEALWSQESWELHNPPSATDLAFASVTAESIKRADPDGSRAMELLQRFSKKDKPKN